MDPGTVKTVADVKRFLAEQLLDYTREVNSDPNAANFLTPDGIDWQLAHFVTPYPVKLVWYELSRGQEPTIRGTVLTGKSHEMELTEEQVKEERP